MVSRTREYAASGAIVFPPIDPEKVQQSVHRGGSSSAVPILVFLAAVWVSSAFRSFVMAANLPLLTAVQAWRFAGFGFLALSAHQVLPGSFAWPAGLGDMAIGLTAPWAALTLARRPAFAASWLFVVWNLLGILDLVNAVGLAAVNQIHATGAAGEITVAPMAELPLLLVPAYLVPLFFIWHLTALFQARRLALIDRSERLASVSSMKNAGARPFGLL
jgi:hypothetical protein